MHNTPRWDSWCSLQWGLTHMSQRSLISLGWEGKYPFKACGILQCLKVWIQSCHCQWLRHYVRVEWPTSYAPVSKVLAIGHTLTQLCGSHQVPLWDARCFNHDPCFLYFYSPEWHLGTSIYMQYGTLMAKRRLSEAMHHLKHITSEASLKHKQWWLCFN